MSKYDCTPCEDLNLEVKHTLFLGLSVKSFNAGVGWNTNNSTLSVVLVEDDCPGSKCCYNECMQEVTWTAPDPGFFGENRWQRANGSEYSSCVGRAPENVGDTLLRAGQDLTGSPSYFRVGDFEWCGIITDWSKEEGCDGNLYRVKLVDPRVILEGIFLITGEYSGCVSQFIPTVSGGTGCPEANVFNVYGYMEQFGVCCPPVGQCGDKNYQIITLDGNGNLLCPSGLPIDGTIFGTPLGGFGGSTWNEDGMPWGQVQLGLNLLANATPANMNCHSPYGRACFCSTVTTIANSGCGLMAPDIDPSASGIDPCLQGKDFYYIDLSHLTQFVHPNYRISGPVISVADLINQLSQDFNFDYYVDLVPFATGSGPGCVTKVIKVYAVNRNVRPDTSVICDFIESNDCVTQKTFGKELRNENTSKFLIGGKKKFIYQIGAFDNPDGGTTCEMESINSLSGIKETRTYTPRATRNLEVLDPCSVTTTSGTVITSNFSCSGMISAGVDITNGAFFSLSAVGIINPVAVGNDWDELKACASISGINLDVSGQFITSTSSTEISDITWENLGSGIELVVFNCEESQVGSIVRQSNYQCIEVSGYPYIDGTTCCESYDDAIVPYFGTDYNGDLLVPCKDGDGNWFFDAPVAEIQSALSEVNFDGATHVRITEMELRAALEGYDAWWSFIMHAATESSVIFGKDSLPQRALVPVAIPYINGESLIPRDFSNPSVNKFLSLNDSTAQRRIDDQQAVYNWVLTFARENYGKQFAIRAPFTCCSWDAENQRTRISETPVNRGGWTEEGNVLGLVNNDPNREGQFDFLNFFRDEQGRVTPFVRYDKGILKTISNLDSNDYLVYYEVPSNLAGPLTNTGPPTVAPSGADSAVWIDEITGLVYVWVNNSEWRPVTDACVYQNSLPPTATTEVPADCFGVYLDTTNCDIYLNTNINLTPGTDVKGNYFTGGNWINVNFYLYVRVQVQETYEFHDKSDCWSPRIIVSVPQSVHLREEAPVYIGGLEENARALFNSRPTCSGAFTEDLPGQSKRIFGNGTSDDAWFRIHEKACMPDCAAIPMESNNITYGPWFNPASGCGRTEVVQDNSLVPWNFGSYSVMNQAAQFVVDNARADMKVGELGQVCLPGYPTLPLGAELGAVEGGYYGGGSYLIENRSLDDINFSGTNGLGNLVSLTYQNWQQPAVWTGLYGPNITNISVTGDCPPNTCYSMRTFAPPRNDGIAKWTLNQLQTIRNGVNYQFREIKRLIDENEQLRFARSFFSEGDRRLPPKGEIQQPGGNNSIMQGNITPWNTVSGNAGFSRPFAGSLTSEQMSEQIQHGYNTTAYMSQDGFFRPVSLYGDGGLPRFAQCTGSGLDGTGVISAGDLNPFQNPTSLDSSGTLNKVARLRSDTSGVGHDIDIVGRSSSNGAVGQGSISIDGYNSQSDGDYATDYRMMALRGPLIMTAWGYDCDGNPVPNKNDTEENASNGIFINSGQDPNKFLDGHLRKSHTWATGPIDLRWDPVRCVWKANGAGGDVDIKCYVATEGIPIDQSGALIINCDSDIYDRCEDINTVMPDLSGTNKSNCPVQIGDNVLTVLPSGATQREIVCSFPPRIDPTPYRKLKVGEPVGDCCYSYGFVKEYIIDDSVTCPSHSGVTTCNYIGDTQQVFVINPCSIPADQCVDAILVDECGECNGERLPVYAIQDCGICCPITLDAGGDVTSVNPITFRFIDSCYTERITLCWYPCVATAILDPTGHTPQIPDTAWEDWSVEGSPTGASPGAWVAWFECTGQIPKRAIQFEVSGIPPNMDGADDFIFFEIDDGCTLNPSWNGNTWIYDPNDSEALIRYTGSYSNLSNPTCVLLYEDVNTPVLENCTFKYWMIMRCGDQGGNISMAWTMGHFTDHPDPFVGNYSVPSGVFSTNPNCGQDNYIVLPYWEEGNPGIGGPSGLFPVDDCMNMFHYSAGTADDNFGRNAYVSLNISGFGNVDYFPFEFHRFCGCRCDYTPVDPGINFPPLCVNFDDDYCGASDDFEWRASW